MYALSLIAKHHKLPAFSGIKYQLLNETFGKLSSKEALDEIKDPATRFEVNNIFQTHYDVHAHLRGGTEKPSTILDLYLSGLNQTITPTEENVDIDEFQLINHKLEGVGLRCFKLGIKTRLPGMPEARKAIDSILLRENLPPIYRDEWNQ
jgi:hypothetical protein